MPDLHLFGGEKGGVGKSLVCRTAIQYNIDKGEDFDVFETDRSNPDIKRIYGSVIPCGLGVFSEGEMYEDSANQIYLSALERRVLVNLPSQIMPALKQFFEENEIFELASEEGVSFYLWFVSDGEFDSLNILRKSLEYFQGNLKHIVVKNNGLNSNWKLFSEDESLQNLLRKYDASIVEFPKFFGNAAIKEINQKSLTFERAWNDKSINSINRQRTKSFLKKAYKALESAEVF